MSLSLKLGSIGLHLGGKFLLTEITASVTKAFVSNNPTNIYLFKAVVETLDFNNFVLVSLIITLNMLHLCVMFLLLALNM